MAWGCFVEKEKGVTCPPSIAVDCDFHRELVLVLGWVRFLFLENVQKAGAVLAHVVFVGVAGWRWGFLAGLCGWW